MQDKLAQRARNNQQSKIREVTRYIESRGGVNLGQGTCALPPHPRVLEAAQRAIGAGHNSYTRFDGIPRLKEAIANRQRAYNRLPITPANVLVTSGATGAFECICKCFIEPGDEVILLEPAYEYHVRQVVEQGGVPRFARLRPPAWTLASEELERVINIKTKMLVMSNPNNPTGRVFSAAELETIGSICRKAGVIVVSDEVYEYILAEGYSHTSIASLPGMFDHTLTLSSASKTFFVTGWRLGWIIGPESVMQALGVKSDQTYVCAPAPFQEAIAECMNFGEDFFKDIARVFEPKRRRLCDALRSAGFKFHLPEGAYYILGEYDKLSYSSDLEAMRGLLEETGVGSVPGAAFFPTMENTGLLRFCFALADDLLDLACERLSSYPLAYWKEAVKDLPGQLNLPSDRPRPNASACQEESVLFRLDAGTHNQLLALAKETNGSLFMTLHAGVAALLTRLGAGTDIPIGSMAAKRISSASDRAEGLGANKLTLRVDTSGNPSFLELLRRMRETELKAYAHQNPPLEMPMEELKPTPATSWRSPFQVMLIFEDASDSDFERSAPTNSGPLGAGSDLIFRMRELRTADGSPGALFGRIEYASELFDRETVDAMARRLVRLLESVAADAERRIGWIDLIEPEERRRILEEWNDTTRETPEATLPELFEAQVERNPEAVAVVFEDASLTYKELNERANQLAHLLIAEGIGPEDIIALAVPRSIEMMVSLLGILKAGAAYLPLDPDYPSERLGFMMEDAMPVCLVATQQALLDPQFVRQAIILGEKKIGDALARSPNSNPGNNDRKKPLHPENPAYVIYTSGSTGKPKGVVVTHRGIPSLADAQAMHFGTTSGSRVLQFASLSFDISVLEIIMALTTGGALALISPEMRSGVALQGAMIAHCLTHAVLSPTVVGTLQELPVGTLVVGGEACPPELVARWSEGRLMINGYGPTETTVGATMSEPLSGGSSAPIGRPITNTRVYVLDENLQPAPMGVAGELYVAGAGLARGYLNRPGLTAERFIADPHGDPGARMYRTGDLVKWRRDGNLEFLGRVDDQVKIRGVRVELGEIESALLRDENVAQAVVVMREDCFGEERLVGYVTAASGRSIDESELRRRVCMSLPGFMRPAAIVTLESLPLNVNGKVDRKALPAPKYTPRQWSAPRTPQEEILCALYADLLSVDRVGVDDDFFDLGGDSVTSIRLVSRARKAGLRITSRDVFQYPTVSALASAIEGVAANNQPSVRE